MFVAPHGSMGQNSLPPAPRAEHGKIGGVLYGSYMVFPRILSLIPRPFGSLRPVSSQVKVVSVYYDGKAQDSCWFQVSFTSPSMSIPESFLEPRTPCHFPPGAVCRTPPQAGDELIGFNLERNTGELMVMNGINLVNVVSNGR
jgi:hypothetical protein